MTSNAFDLAVEVLAEGFTCQDAIDEWSLRLTEEGQRFCPIAYELILAECQLVGGEAPTDQSGVPPPPEAGQPEPPAPDVVDMSIAETAPPGDIAAYPGVPAEPTDDLFLF
jgi:hypothetical protein